MIPERLIHGQIIILKMQLIICLQLLRYKDNTDTEAVYNYRVDNMKRFVVEQ